MTRSCSEIFCATTEMKDIAFLRSAVRVRKHAFQSVRNLKHVEFNKLLRNLDECSIGL